MVFLMQPLGQLAANVVGLSALAGLNRHFDFQHDGPIAVLGMDILWRVITGVGAIPAIVAILLRWFIPESGRYTFAVHRNQPGILRALKDTKGVYRSSFARSRSLPQTQPQGEARLGDGRHDSALGNGNVNGQVPAQARTDMDAGRAAPYSGDDSSDYASLFAGQEKPKWWKVWKLYTLFVPPPTVRADIWQYFITEGNVIHLLGVSICSFVVDFAFYGLGLNSPGPEGALWSHSDQKKLLSPWLNQTIVSPPWSLNCTTTSPSNWPDGLLGLLDSRSNFTMHNGCVESMYAAASNYTPSWLANSAATDTAWSIYKVLYQNITESLVTVAAWSLAGGILMVFLINKWERRVMLISSFVVLFFLLLATGILFRLKARTNAEYGLVPLSMLIQLVFSLGPNTLTFVIPAEIFPTEYRCTCHGIAAACGKLGAIMVQVAYLTWGRGFLSTVNSRQLGSPIVIFAILMLAGAVFAWAWLPNIQQWENLLPPIPAMDSRNSSRSVGDAHTGRLNVADAEYPDDHIPASPRVDSNTFHAPEKGRYVTRSLETLGRGRREQAQWEKTGFVPRTRLAIDRIRRWFNLSPIVRTKPIKNDHFDTAH
ncbi:hypothetical protein BAUCODRAFT_125794 [Baudoinia panamericana UAMH 10762]|uniref:Major facilitator superfamily (MFS) profile domain-containing protein n=1 Tax=Baudoinia panamericana (strain UAMH 10762) TaxID=717646 RepID=M2N2C9_BAUPA|nr:uncharacterized protein BAUCODRAFT_125794 [Baudoinia panamericana UAMH 10762]EMC92830.1 hypothetical protein BAUCODRAFT_125794 [Baudoinia panamericana UAMH 10762]